MINEDAVLRFAQEYGDTLGVLKTSEHGEQLIHVPIRNATIRARIDERMNRVPAEHNEMPYGPSTLAPARHGAGLELGGQQREVCGTLLVDHEKGHATSEDDHDGLMGGCLGALTPPGGSSSACRAIGGVAGSLH